MNKNPDYETDYQCLSIIEINIFYNVMNKYNKYVRTCTLSSALFP